MLLTVRNVTKSYGAITVLHNISFVVNAASRIGLVGPNGVGKSTLLRMLVGQEEMESGSVTYGPLVEFGYLPQTTPDFYGNTVQDLILESVGNLKRLEERMHDLETRMAITDPEHLPMLLEEYDNVSTRFQDRGGYDLDYKIDSILDGLRLSYLPRTQAVDTLSGGEKARLGVAALLLRSPDILLLDEPTNHLDFASMSWLETYLANYNGAVLMVSHDRQFLNRAVNAIFEIDEHDHHLKAYEGNYDAYVQAKAAERKKWEEEYERQQEEIQDLRKRIKNATYQVGHGSRPARDNDKFVRYFLAQNVDSAISRNVKDAEERLKRIEADPIQKPPELLRVNSQFRAIAMPSQTVLELTHVTKNIGERRLFDDVNLTVSARTRMTLTGANGTGKTTLLKLIMGLETADAGDIRVATSAHIGYLPQDSQLDLNKTILETYKQGQVGYEGELIGRLLGYGLFRLEDMHKTVRQLSIGQRRKLEIACLMASQSNVLLLDEPTNYISLDVLEAFEAAIIDFPGPVIAISHDRWFIERFGGEIWEISHGHVEKHDDIPTTSRQTN